MRVTRFSPGDDGESRFSEVEIVHPHERLDAFGHTITSDSFIYLQDLRSSGRVPRGSRLLLFTYGFGSSWCALLLEH